VASGPGAGKYAMPSLLQSKSDFNRGNTSTFHQPIAQSHNKQHILPGPTDYEVWCNYLSATDCLAVL